MQQGPEERGAQQEAAGTDGCMHQGTAGKGPLGESQVQPPPCKVPPWPDMISGLSALQAGVMSMQHMYVSFVC